MRLFRIFLLQFERVFQYRSMIFVWFLVSLFHPLIYLMFWKGRAGAVSFGDVSTYYLLFIIAGGFFVHVEGDARYDMVQGNLSLYLMKPFSYLRTKFFSELPWRLIQGFFGLVTLSLLVVIGHIPLSIVLTVENMVTALMIAVGGYLIMFLLKMIVLILALWMEDIGGLQQFVEMLIIIFAGFVMPIRYFPPFAAAAAHLTPFPYMLYYPVIAFQGQLPIPVFQLLIAQAVWLILLYVVYQRLWTQGIRKYSAVGI